MEALAHTNTGAGAAVASYGIVVENALSLFKALNAKDEKAEGLFRYSFVTKEARPNPNVSELLLRVCKRLLLVLV